MNALPTIRVEDIAAHAEFRRLDAIAGIVHDLQSVRAQVKARNEALKGVGSAATLVKAGQALLPRLDALRDGRPSACSDAGGLHCNPEK